MTSSITVTLPWPDKALWQNARVHWAVLRSATRAARQQAHWECQIAGIRYLTITGRPLLIWYVAPPDRRKRDFENFKAAMKPALDGIQDALGIDDTHFRNKWPCNGFAEPVKGGNITVTISDGGKDD